MEFRFYINNVEIDEPVGFDATKIKLKRSENWHGVMTEDSEETVEFYGSGFDILSGLYLISGIDAVAVFRIEYYCNGELQDSIEYNITFYEYAEFCGGDCYCSVGIEKSGCFYQFRNAMDTKVNLDALKTIDKTTDLAEYEYLGKETEIPSKTIVLTSKAISEDVITRDLTIEVDVEYDLNYTGAVQIALWLPFQTEQLTELQEFVTIQNWELDFGAIDDTIANDNYTYKNLVTDIQCLGNSYDIAINSSGTLTIVTTATLTPISVTFVVAKREGSTPTTLFSDTLIDTGSGFTKTYNWDVSELITETLIENDLLLFYIFINATKTTTGAITEFSVTHNEDNLVSITTNSLCEPTNAKLYLVNETLSHISEFVTNNCLRVYSEYLGRIDSQPYNFADDGCGGMLGLTSGLFLRRIEDVMTGDKAPILSLSFNDVINAVNAINPIGFTIETNGEDEVIRIEDWKYFYNDTVITDLGSVSVKKTPNLKLHFKNYKTGYSKYEAEEYNGLDEFLTEREYTTSLVNHNATLEKVCQFIASGYAIEITRRKGNTDTKDWRFDNDTFFICLSRLYTSLEVEQGNITNDANIIDASTILNFRISPAHMTMAWFQFITTFLKTTKELLFSSGKGNTAAQGELISVCSIANGVVSEKENITQSLFFEDQNGIYLPELHEIQKVPFTFQQYKLVQANPHGLFAYACDATQRYGWLQEISYDFVNGEADLILIPKI
jgi:hypothetical protein